MNKLIQTKAQVNAARQQLEMTAQRLQARLAPPALAVEALAVVGKRACTLALTAVSSPNTRPYIAVGMIVGGAAYLLRKPILTAIAKRLPKETDNE